MTRPRSATDRARAVAVTLLADLRRLAPELAQLRERAALAAGEGWLSDAAGLDAAREEVVSVQQAHAETGVAAATIRKWCSLPEVPVTRYPGGVLLSEVVAYQQRPTPARSQSPAAIRSRTSRARRASDEASSS